MLDGPYEPASIDRAAQDLWERLGVFRFDPASPAPIFSIDTPPPTVSGSLHIGHVFSYTQAECIARYQRMRGKNVFYPFGFDGNGLPTERLTEKEHGVQGRSLARSEFVALCLATSRRYERQFEALWRSLGISSDWSLTYSTIDERCIRISQRAFLDLVHKQEVYQKSAPTMWDTETQTAVAQAELVPKEKRTSFNDVRFDLEGGGSVTIATTRPELLCACVALFLHPGDPRAGALVGRRALVPLFGHAVEILADDLVDPAKGTGVVMCCTFGDKTDVEWCNRHPNLAVRAALAPDGKLTALAGPESGLYANQARKAILARLEAAGHLVSSREIDHVVQTFERTGREIEFLVTRQWFVRLLPHKQDLLRLGDEVRWFPAHMGKRYRNWVEGLEWDWCISRQRFFGVPFPVWFCTGCETPRFATDAELPVDPAERPYQGVCPRCGGQSWRGERDVMDTWSTSSETPQINALWGDPGDRTAQLLPMSLRPQAHDIIRTWAFYTIAKSWLHGRRLPWRDAMISGHVQAPGKQKISKSLGNAPADPAELVSSHGADAVRYWALSATLGNDYLYSTEDLARGRALGVKLWNAGRLASQHLDDHDPTTHASQAADRWIRARVAATADAVTADLEAYEFGTAKGKVEQLFWNDFCDNYLELIKGRLHDRRPEAAEARRAAQAGLADALSAILRLLAPFVPHVCESLWQTLFAARTGEPSVARAPWPLAPAAWRDARAAQAGDAAVTLLTALRRWRSEQKVSPGVPLAEARLRVGARVAASAALVFDDVRAAARVADLVLLPDDALPEDGVVLDSVRTA